MYNDQEDMSTNEKGWTHDWMNVYMIIAIMLCNLALILKAQPRWMELNLGSSISFIRLSKCTNLTMQIKELELNMVDTI